MLKPLASVEDLQDRVSEEISDPVDVRLATRMLRYASSMARSNGRPWTAAFCPDEVVDIVIEAAARGYLNAAGYAQERGDMLDIQRASDFAKGAALTRDEIKAVRAAARRGGWTSVTLVRPDTVSDDQVSGGGSDSSLESVG